MAQSDILLEVGTNELEIIEFTVAGRHYGINVAKVKKVVHYQPSMLTQVSEVPHGVEGIIYFQGKPILLVNLRSILSIEGEAPRDDRRLAIITQFNDIISSYLIDGVNRIHRLSWSKLQPFEDVIPGSTASVTGTITIGDRVIMLLDLEHLMSKIVPENSIHASSATAKGISHRGERKNVRILFAEDSSMIRKMTSGQLHEAGFTNIQLFENGKRAYDHISAEVSKAISEGKDPNGLFDLLLTDIEMPMMDGLTLCKNTRETLGLKTLPIVMYSSLINEQMAAKCRTVGSTAHISKPRIDQIVAIIDQHCGVAA
ncbi:two-component system, chemotaxis family, response regulator CheV [Verrucomicrobium sp. GAS474]|uniref:chemotaxis protein CheV n=1 Tax=Verrucomicrobium sp. GAS474 TaxID=1882831 RepID=UPI00087C8743|nr:chemotaxis protein [Verrucomicrobium sp. GAS474]SDU21282.1 two-component system, chemotaxis family, response regulator CheV [Verrucomicrobium sp. GAS474]